MSFLTPKKPVTTTAPKVRVLQTDKERAAYASSFVNHPFWHEVKNALAAMRDGALGELRNRKDTLEADVQALEAWRAADSVTRRIEEFPDSVIESAKEMQWRK